MLKLVYNLYIISFVLAKSRSSECHAMKRQRDLTRLKADLGIVRSLLDEGLITKAAFREIQAAAETYDLQRRDFGENIVRQTR